MPDSSEISFTFMAFWTCSARRSLRSSRMRRPRSTFPIEVFLLVPSGEFILKKWGAVYPFPRLRLPEFYVTLNVQIPWRASSHLSKSLSFCVKDMLARFLGPVHLFLVGRVVYRLVIGKGFGDPLYNPDFLDCKRFRLLFVS